MTLGRLARVAVVALLVAAICGIAVWAESADPPQNAPPVTWRDYFIFLAQAGCYALLIASILVFVTKRLIFALATTAVIMFLVTLMSKFKYIYLQQKLLFSDFIYQLRELAEIRFFLQNYASIAIGILAVVVAAGAVIYAVFVFDRTRVRRVVSLCAVLASLALVEFAWRQVDPLYRDTVFAHASASNRHLSNFTVSARMFVDHANAPFTLGSSNLQPSSTAPAPVERGPAPAVRPHIIVILHESSVDPSIYLEDERYAVQRAFFASGDNEVRRLNVKAYGGKTWISEHGFVLGADVSYFSSRKDFLGVVATGKFKNSIANELGSLGYRTVVDYPAPTTFLNTRGFYKSLGFDTVNSEKDMNLEIKFTGPRPRDRDYYNFMIEDLAKHQKEDGDTRPSFYFVLTSATHYPWNYQEFPGVRNDEYVPGDPVAEYVRRQRIAGDDLAGLKTALAERFPGQPFLIAGFGDHHPLWTHDYVHKLTSWKGRPPDPAEHMWRTYYRVDGLNFSPDYKALSREIEIGLLGESVLTAAKLPIGPSYQVRRWLREQCDGRWADCANQDSLQAANALLSKGPLAIFKD